MSDTNPPWLRDEAVHLGVDYADPALVAEYDARHRRFRDYEKEAETVFRRLGLGAESRVVDLGCGTGAFSLAAARRCRQVLAVDVSPAMLAYCRAQAEREGLRNLSFQRAGFLTWQIEAPPPDAIVSVAALHHLPEFWKAVALQRIYDALPAGGKFYLFDVVFSFPIAEWRKNLDDWLETMSKAGDATIADEAATHFRDEFSAFDWVLEGFFSRIGFRTLACYREFPMCSAYLLARPFRDADLVFRPVGESDAETLLDLQKRAYRSEAELYDDWTIQPLTQTLEELRADLRRVTALAAMAGDRMIGSVRAELDSDGVCHVQKLCVAPAFQGLGVGKRLLEAIEAAFPSAHSFTLFTGHRSERNLRLYQRQGYRETHRRKINPQLTFVHLMKSR